MSWMPMSFSFGELEYDFKPKNFIVFNGIKSGLEMKDLSIAQNVGDITKVRFRGTRFREVGKRLTPALLGRLRLFLRIASCY